MRSKFAAAILFAGVMTLLAPRPASAAWSVSISYFHQELSPYGRWVHTRAYGEIWYPTAVAAGWEPYVDGEWIYTECGWTWVSSDPFEDPFHYGTWVWVDPYGWCWEPGYVWGPAWVTWAWTDGYIGWAPLPATFAISVTGYSGGPVTVAQNRYVFVPMQQFAGTNVSTVRVAAAQNPTILARARRTTRFSVSGGLVHASGPPTSLVQRATGKPVRAVSVSSHKLRPTRISATGIRSGRKVPIVAPAHEREAAARVAASRGRTSSARIAHREATAPKGAPPKVAAAGHRGKEKAPARVERIERRAPPRQAVAPRHETKLSGQRGEKPSIAAAHRPESHRAAVSSGSPPKSVTVEKRHESPPHVVREEHRTAMNRPSGQQHPARQEAPPPRAAQAPPRPPPAVAARPPEHPQPQGQPRGPKKDKEKP